MVVADVLEIEMLVVLIEASDLVDNCDVPDVEGAEMMVVVVAAAAVVGHKIVAAGLVADYDEAHQACHVQHVNYRRDDLPHMYIHWNLGALGLLVGGEEGLDLNWVFAYCFWKLDGSLTAVVGFAAYGERERHY